MPLLEADDDGAEIALLGSMPPRYPMPDTGPECAGGGATGVVTTMSEGGGVMGAVVTLLCAAGGTALLLLLFLLPAAASLPPLSLSFLPLLRPSFSCRMISLSISFSVSLQMSVMLA